jgi:hypothetical protein
MRIHLEDLYWATFCFAAWASLAHSYVGSLFCLALTGPYTYAMLISRRRRSAP